MTTTPPFSFSTAVTLLVICVTLLAGTLALINHSNHKKIDDFCLNHQFTSDELDIQTLCQKILSSERITRSSYFKILNYIKN